MANWTIKTGFPGGEQPYCVVSDLSDYAWFLDANDTTALWQYRFSTNTLTQMIDTVADFAGESLDGISYFKGAVYFCLQEAATGDDLVYELTGVGTFTLRLTVAAGVGVGSEQGWIWSNDNYMLFLRVANATATDTAARHTANGTAWSTTTIAGSAPLETPLWDPELSPTWFPGEMYIPRVDTADLNDAIHRFDEASTTLVKEKVNPGTSYYQSLPDLPLYHWGNDSGELTTDWTVILGGYPYPIWLVNTALTYGIVQPARNKLQIFDGISTWIDLDTFPGTITPNSVGSYIIQMTNGDGYIFGYNNANTQYEIFERDAALPGGNAKFYQGTDTLTYRSVLPLNGVNPDGMLTPDEDVVYLGADEANDPQIVSGSSADTYAAWTDIDTGVPTTSNIRAIKKV